MNIEIADEVIENMNKSKTITKAQYRVEMFRLFNNELDKLYGDLPFMKHVLEVISKDLREVAETMRYEE